MEFATTLTTTSQLIKYLDSKNIPHQHVSPISGGSSNFLWRMTTPSGEKKIVKHAEPFLAGRPATPFPLYRMGLEVHALDIIPQLLASDDQKDGMIRLPTLTSYDKDSHVLILDDMGRDSLHNVYEDPRLDIKMIGEAVGRWLARLHNSTTGEEIKRKFEHPTARSMYRWNFNNLSSVLKRYGYNPAPGERLNARYGALLETDELCVCHGDLWPGNILVSGLADQTQAENPRLTVIDWEVARLGNGVTDVAHFAGEAWLLDHLRGGRGLMKAFLNAYLTERPLSDQEKQRVAAQFGTHITHWPTIYGWIQDKDKAGCISHGNLIIQMVDVMKWDSLKSSELGILFTTTKEQTQSTTLPK
uniref:Aminoglycoside phosphotransferase domain-containing protein n=2 Tax=Bionectria ochroleuca TaxID=29856 RepID=A0A0B7KEG1_BIOOC